MEKNTNFKIIYFILLQLSWLRVEASNIQVLKKTTEQIKKSNVQGLLAEFVHSSLPNRFIKSEGKEKAMNFIYKTLQENKSVTKNVKLLKQLFKVKASRAKEFYQNDFAKNIKTKYNSQHKEFIKWSQITSNMQQFAQKYDAESGQNIILRYRNNTSKKLLVIGAHYDSFAFDWKKLSVIESGKYPGADYNASGVVSLLQVYKTLSQVQWKHNIDFVFWDLQAYAFAGAYHYVKELKDEIQQKKLDFQGAIVLEMLGHDSKVFDQDKRNFNFEVHTSEIGMSHHSQEIALAKKIKQNVLKIKRLPINFEIKSKGFNRSDHWAFWAFQLPAILYTQNWEKDYNQKGHMTALDIPERINYRTLYQSTRFLAQGLGVWLMND